MLFSMENTNGKHSQIKYINSFLGVSVMQQWLHKGNSWEMHIDKTARLLWIPSHRPHRILSQSIMQLSDIFKNPALSKDLECIAKPLDCVWRTKINNLHLKKQNKTSWINCAAPLWWAPVNKGKSKSSFFRTNIKGWRESREISVFNSLLR